MPIERSEAFILHTFNFSEQDKIVTFFTLDKGIIKGIAKGARKFGNRFGSSLEPMSYVNIVYYEKEGRDLDLISQCDLQESFFEIQSNVKATFTLGYFSELIQEFLPLHSREDLIFRLLHKTLQALQKGGDLEMNGAYFEAWMLKINGLIPDFSTCRKCGEKICNTSWLTSRKDGVYCTNCATQKKDSAPPDLPVFIKWARKNPPPEAEVPQFSMEQLKAIRKTLQHLIIFHMEKEPKSLRFLRQGN